MSDHAQLASLFCCPPWNKPGDIWARYQKAQAKESRLFIVGELAAEIVGYVTLILESNHPAFASDLTPEVSDLNVHPMSRGAGLGNAMLQYLEDFVRAEGGSKIGLGVGLYADYGSAQRIYARRSYIPDGSGLYYRHHAVLPGEKVRVDDDLFITMTKDLSNNTS